MMQLLRCELVCLVLPIKEEDFMGKFLSPSTRLELQRFMNWEEWLAEVTEGTDDREVVATGVRSANSLDLVFDIAASQSRPAAPPTAMTA
jgi:hypothetical protein